MMLILVKILILMLTVCPPITPPMPLWLKNWELKYILLAAWMRYIRIRGLKIFGIAMHVRSGNLQCPLISAALFCLCLCRHCNSLYQAVPLSVCAFVFVIAMHLSLALYIVHSAIHWVKLSVCLSVCLCLTNITQVPFTWAALERLNWSAVMAIEAAVGCKPGIFNHGGISQAGWNYVQTHAVAIGCGCLEPSVLLSLDFVNLKLETSFMCIFGQCEES